MTKKVAHKIAEATGEFIGNNIAEKKCKTKTCAWCELKKCWRNDYFPREKRRNTEQIKTSIVKMEHHKISKLLTLRWQWSL